MNGQFVWGETMALAELTRRVEVLEREVERLTIAQLTKRVEALEQKVERLQQANQQPALEDKPAKPWWDEIRGMWAGDSEMRELVDLGRKYRESLRPNRSSSRR